MTISSYYMVWAFCSVSNLDNTIELDTHKMPILAVNVRWIGKSAVVVIMPKYWMMKSGE